MKFEVNWITGNVFIQESKNNGIYQNRIETHFESCLFVSMDIGIDLKMAFHKNGNLQTWI